MALISQPGSDYQIASISLDAGYTRDLILMLTDVHAVLDHLYLDGTQPEITSPAEDYLRESASPYTLPALIDALGEVTGQLSRAERQALDGIPPGPPASRTSRQQSCRQLLTRRSPAHRAGPDQRRTPTPAPLKMGPNKRRTVGPVGVDTASSDDMPTDWDLPHAVAAGNRAPMAAVRHKMAKAEGAGIQDEDGIERTWLRRRGTAFPAVEHFLVAAPPDHWTRTAPASRQPGRRQHPQPTPGTRIRPESEWAQIPDSEPSVPCLSVVPVCYGCKGVRRGS